MTISIRPARSSDAAHLPAVERSAGERFRTLPDLAWIAEDSVMPADAHRFLIEQGAVWVAEDASAAPVGFLTAETFEDALHIWELAVRRELQGQGIGRRLIAAAVEGALARGLAAVTLTTFRNVAWNEPFYARLGFRILREQKTDARLAAVLEHEAELGLPIERRVAMRLDIRRPG